MLNVHVAQHIVLQAAFATPLSARPYPDEEFMGMVKKLVETHGSESIVVARGAS